MKLFIYNCIITVLSTIAPNADCCSSHVILMSDKHVRLMHTRSSQSLIQYDDISPEKYQWKITTAHTHQLRLHHHHRHNQRQNSNKKNESTTADVKNDKAADYANVLWRKCPPKMDVAFCLNGGQCFDFPILNASLLSCKCPDNFGGERCELKNIDFNHPILYPRVPHVALAKVYLAPVLIYFLACVTIYILGLKLFTCFPKHTLLRGKMKCCQNSYCYRRP